MGLLSRLFRPKDAKAALQGHKTVHVCGSRFVIRKINPVLDFTAENMPMIFSSYQTRRKVDPAQAAEMVDHARVMREMMAVVKAGLVEPQLVEAGKGEFKGREVGITIDDIFRDTDLGSRLYLEILDHTLNRFRGLKKVFFSMQIKRGYSIACQKIMDAAQAP